MQILIKHEVKDGLVLPLSYHHIIQAIIYENLRNAYGYSQFVHDEGMSYGQRSYKLFTFSRLRGKYKIADKKIIFYDTVEFEISSPDIFMIRLLADNISSKGITYGEKTYEQVQVYLSDSSVENNDIKISMLSPICVYSSDNINNKTYYYAPDEEEFDYRVNENFIRKYKACYGTMPQSGIHIEPINVTSKDKYVTKYKNTYITGWTGEYRLCGERKYLDFVYQTGLGSKNSQGFGMFEII